MKCIKFKVYTYYFNTFLNVRRRSVKRNQINSYIIILKRS